MDSVSSRLLRQMVEVTANRKGHLDLATEDATLRWMAEPGGDKATVWKSAAKISSGDESKLLHAALTHGDDTVRLSAWSTTTAAHDVLLRVLANEQDLRVLAAAVLAHDFPVLAVRSLLTPMTPQLADAIATSDLAAPHRVPLDLWDDVLTHVTDARGKFSWRQLLEDVVEKDPAVGLLALRNAECLPTLRMVAARNPVAPMEDIEAMLESVQPQITDAHTAADRLLGVLCERDDTTARALRLLRPLVGLYTGEQGDRLLGTLDRRLLCGRPLKHVADQIAAATSDVELLTLVAEIPDACWDGPEFLKVLMKHTYAGPGVYRFAQGRSGLEHHKMLEHMSRDFVSSMVWDDLALALEIWADPKAASDMSNRFHGSVSDRVRKGLVDRTLTAPESIWAHVYGWGGDEEGLSELVPVLRVAGSTSGGVSDRGVLRCALDRLAPALQAPAGRALLDQVNDPELTVGDFMATYDAATAEPAP